MIKIIPLLVVSLLVAITAAIDNPHHAASKYQYQYQYGVNDGQTGDHKSHWEHRDGDHVEGQYTVADADGTHRVVQYKADPTVGFQVHVKREGQGNHPHGQSYTIIDQQY